MAEEEKVRKRFEAWCEMQPLGKGLIQPFMRLRADEKRYFYSRIEFAWLAWKAAYALGREDGIEEAAQTMCEFCRGEVNDYNSQRIPGQWRGKNSNGWWHTSKVIGQASEPCNATRIRSLSRKSDVQNKREG